MKAQPLWNSIPDRVRAGRGAEDSSAIGVFTSLIIPDASPLQQDVMNRMFATAMTGEDAARFLEAAVVSGGDLSDQLSQIAVPTLVVHARGDRLVPFEAGGRELAAGIPGAKLVVLETDNYASGRRILPTPSTSRPSTTSSPRIRSWPSATDGSFAATGTAGSRPLRIATAHIAPVIGRDSENAA